MNNQTEQMNGKNDNISELDLSSYPSLDELMKEFSETDELDIVVGESPNTDTGLAEISALRDEVAELQREKREMSVSFTRAQADFENYRKRVEREKTENYRFALIAVINRLLPILDNFERALATPEKQNFPQTPEFTNFINGIGLIYQQIQQVLDEMGVKPLETIGKMFDPAFHDAVATEATGKVAPNTIVEEILKGYRMGDKLIRAAMVKVATAENESEVA